MTKTTKGEKMSNKQNDIVRETAEEAKKELCPDWVGCMCHGFVRKTEDNVPQADWEIEFDRTLGNKLAYIGTGGEEHLQKIKDFIRNEVIKSFRRGYENGIIVGKNEKV